MSGGGRLQMPGLQAVPACAPEVTSVTYDGGSGYTNVEWTGGQPPFAILVATEGVDMYVVTFTEDQNIGVFGSDAYYNGFKIASGVVDVPPTGST